MKPMANLAVLALLAILGAAHNRSVDRCEGPGVGRSLTLNILFFT